MTLTDAIAALEEVAAASTNKETTAVAKDIGEGADLSQVSFEIMDIEGSTGGFSSSLLADNVVEINGLDGITFVLEVSYDETLLLDETDATAYRVALRSAYLCPGGDCRLV